MRTDIIRIAAIVAITTLLFAVPAQAELRRVELKTLGMD
jgi:hypothetical protein